jgi:hypothetical protein
LGTGVAPGAQEPAGVLKVDVKLVTLNARVATPDGKPVRDLTPQTLRVFEDGREQGLAVLEPLSTPLHVALLVDTSMSAASAWEKLVRAAEKFIRDFGAADQIAVYEVGAAVQRLTGFTNDAKVWKRALQQLGRSTGAGSVLYDALLEAQQDFPPDARRRAVVLFSDGVDEGSRGSLDDVSRSLLRNHGLFFAVLPKLAPEPQPSGAGSAANGEWVIVFDLTNAGGADVERFRQTAFAFLDTLGPVAKVWLYDYRSILRLFEPTDTPDAPAARAQSPAEARALLKKLGTPQPLRMSGPSGPKRHAQNLLVLTDRARTGLTYLENYFFMENAAVFAPEEHTAERRRALLSLLVHHRDEARRAMWLRLREASERMRRSAEDTGGEALTIESLEDLPDSFRVIGEQIRSSYTLAYYSGAAPGRHAVRVETPGRPWSVRARRAVLIE